MDVSIFLGGTDTGPQIGFFGERHVFGPVSVCAAQEACYLGIKGEFADLLCCAHRQSFE